MVPGFQEQPCNDALLSKNIYQTCQVRLKKMQDSFIVALASPDQPIPGGGAAAAYAGSVALALLKKIVRVEMRRHQGISEDSPWEDLLDQVSALGQNLYRLSDEDGRSYLRLAEIKNSGQSEKEVASALKEAI